MPSLLSWKLLQGLGGDHARSSSGHTEPNSPISPSHKSESPLQHPSLLSLGTPTYQPTPPVTQPAAHPVLLTPPEPIANATPEDSAPDQACSPTPDDMHDAHRTHDLDSTCWEHEQAAPAAARPSVPPLRLPPTCTGSDAAASAGARADAAGGTGAAAADDNRNATCAASASSAPGGRPAHSPTHMDAPGKIVAYALDLKGGAVAIPRMKAHASNSGSGVLLPPLHSSRVARCA